MFHRQQPASAPKSAQATDPAAQKPAEAAQTSNKSQQSEKKEGTTMSQASDNTSQNQANRTPDIPAAQGNTGYPAGRGFGASQFGGNTYSGSVAGSANSRQLIIGQGITMSGEIASCDHLVVEGHVEAALKGASVLDVAESGSFNGEVEIEQATIAGSFDGDIRVSGRLTVKSSGQINGTISYGELAVESGATISGTLAPFAAATQSKSSNKGKSSSKSSAKATDAESAATGEAANAAKSGRELPFAASAAE